MAWYNKYRPQDFDEVLGQTLVKSVLENALKKNKIKQAYLLSGPKGTGKTTLARIFASKLNQINNHKENQIDIIELDAASNTGIDNIRQLIESSKNPPISAPYKIYIIDEVHMLSKPAMNALLKILEEPPVYLVFLLATTNPEKLIPTVLSRLTKLSLTSHTISDLKLKLKDISEKEGLEITEEALNLITHRAQGSHRDSINLLETISSYELEKYDEKTVAEILGVLPQDFLLNLALSILAGKLDKVMLEKVEETGVDGQTLLTQLLEFCVDKSFGSETEFDKLILPLAQTLELKYSLNSAVTALAILKTTLGSNLNSPVKGQPTLKESIQFLDQKPVFEEKKSSDFRSNLDLSQNFFQETTLGLDMETSGNELKNKNHFELETELEIEKPKAETDQDIQQVDKENIINFLNELNENQDTPPIFKMLLTDIEVDSLTNEKVLLSVSSGVFLSQLNSAKILSFLKDNLSKHFSKILQVEGVLREHKLEEKAKSDIKKTTPTFSQISTNKTQTNETQATQSSKLNKNIFYKVYNKLPENMENKGVDVLKGPIVDPGLKDDWDEHAENMFEFE